MDRKIIVAVIIAAIIIAGAFVITKTAARVNYTGNARESVPTAATTGVVSNVTPAPPANLAPTLVTETDLAAAGFASPKPQPPTADGMYQPAAYFWVGNSANPTAVNNLVMVSAVSVASDFNTLYKYGSSQTPFTITNGVGQEATLSDTRTAINFIKNGTYVVIIGPTAKEVEALATIVADKLNK